ncbi:MAG: DUF1963 domain-containing protein [Erysipelotrichaceae bacterium]|nr:DUF1963 domain-containing protein [Erysipelotrichaceae bacterium]
MGLLDKVFGNKPEKNTKKVYIPTDEEKETLNRLLALMKEHAKPCIRYNVIESETGLYDSKLGGAYYVPDGMDVPEVNGVKLYLLAQINLEQQPAINGFPTKGLLQFFIADDDDFGLARKDEPCSRAAVRYIPEIPDTENVTVIDEKPVCFPFDPGLSLALVGKKSISVPVPISNDYEKILTESVPELLCKKAWGIGFQNEYLNDTFDMQVYHMPDVEKAGTLLGGYPDFAQDEPREYGTYDTLVFQLDSDMDYVCWGDAGIAQFFISAEDLADCNFNNVLYTWDCG